VLFTKNRAIKIILSKNAGNKMVVKMTIIYLAGTVTDFRVAVSLIFSRMVSRKIG
jgi:hypothetical protein